jgi:hypothetical protein
VRLRLLAYVALTLCGMPFAANAEEPAPPPISNERQGYAFEYPRVLAEQRLFGLAHGIRLLADACAKEEAHAQTTAAAYRQWYEQQQLLIEDLQRNLAIFYYGPENADKAGWSHIAAALSLRDRVSPEPGSDRMAIACATLPEVLQQPRYDLTALFQLEAALAAAAQTVRVETETQACLPKLPEAARGELQSAYAAWQRTEGAAAEQAQAQLQQYWLGAGAAGAADDWKKAVAKRYSQTNDALCAKLADWLQSPEASLAQSFAQAPVIHLPVEDETAPDHSVKAVTLSQPEPAAASVQAPSAPEAVEAAPSASLFDILMKAFDERPYESAGTH